METVWSVLESLSFEPTTFFCQIGLFFLLHGCLTWLVYNPIMTVRNERDAKMGGRLAKAEAKAAKARRLKEEFEAEVRQARLEGQAMVVEETARAEQAAKEKVDQAREQAREILEKAQAEVAKERETALEGMEDTIDDVALSIARQIVKNSLAADDSQSVLAKLEG